MPKFIKKRPVEARQLVGTEGELRAIAGWCGGQFFFHHDWGVSIVVDVKLGTQTACKGDWIVREGLTTYAVFEDKVFKQLYTPVEDS